MNVMKMLIALLTNSFTYLVAFIYCYKLDFEQMNILISKFFEDDRYCFSSNGGTQT